MDTVQLDTVSPRWATLTADTGQTFLPAQIAVAFAQDGKQPASAAWAPPAATEPSPGGLRVSALLTATATGVWSLWVRITDNPSVLVLRVEDVLVVDGAQAYAEPTDLLPLLGPYGRDLPDWVDVDVHLRAAHARALSLLSGTYGDPLPVLGGPGLEVVRHAEAQLAAASLLSSLQTQLVAGAGGTATVEQLRTDALRTLSGRVAGLTSDDPDGDGPLQPPARPSSVAWNGGGPLVRDPYALVDDRPRAWSSLQPDTVWFAGQDGELSVRGQ